MQYASSASSDWEWYRWKLIWLMAGRGSPAAVIAYGRGRRRHATVYREAHVCEYFRALSVSSPHVHYCSACKMAAAVRVVVRVVAQWGAGLTCKCDTLKLDTPTERVSPARHTSTRAE